MDIFKQIKRLRRTIAAFSMPCKVMRREKDGYRWRKVKQKSEIKGQKKKSSTMMLSHPPKQAPKKGEKKDPVLDPGHDGCDREKKT